jgi:hypothetical protein
MRVLVQNEGSGWILDNIANDYKKYSRHEVVEKDPDLVWCISMHRAKDLESYSCKKVISVHHIDRYQIDQYPPMFDSINSHYDYCISPNKITIASASEFISVPFKESPYWILSDKTINIKPKEQTREIVIGSFIKDSWGNRPKLSKGPDILLEVLKELNKKHNIRVVLSGRGGRKYLRKNFDKEGINYDYHNMHPDINQLYNKIDWYFVTSRYEGGPQSILECAYRRVKILSTDVGMARDVLHPECICEGVEDFVNKLSDSVDRTVYNCNQVKNYYMPEVVIPKLDDFFEKVLSEG